MKPAQQRTMIEQLLEVIATLRSPEGCPWDAEQTPESLKPFILEEAYELTDAITSGDTEEIRDELGDCLLQVALLSQIYRESGSFTFDDVARTITEKLIRRHPHVFDRENHSPGTDLNLQWQRIKQEEQSGKKAKNHRPPPPLPSLMLAQKISRDQSGNLREDCTRLAGLAKDLSGKEDDPAEVVGSLLETIARIGNRLDMNLEDLLRQRCQVSSGQSVDTSR